MFRNVGMCCAAYVIACMSFANADTFFAYNYELGDTPFHIKTSGTYHVWAWTPSAEISVKIANITLKPKGPITKLGQGEPAWLPLGEVELEKGTQGAFSEGDLLAVLITNKQEFKPDNFEKAVRVQDSPTSSADPRAEIERHTDTVFSAIQYPNLAAWEKDAETLRRRVLLSSGLYPLPEKTPLNARVFDRKEYGDYSIEKVHFEAYPGFLVTGNLFRPLGKNGPFPAVLGPHGHWEHGRLEESERGSVPARGITLARMGMVAFTYDMLAYNDSLQYKNHRFVNFEDLLWGIHPFGLQLWSSIRALDFLETLPDVDKDRLSCTGASGGGTQTFALSAVDKRVKVSAPVNMISHTMQGGCVCENSPFIRLGHSNMEIGALAAPRPMLLVSATGDWTKDTPTVEYPAIRAIYAHYGAEGVVETVQFDAPHNYNKDSRTAVYRYLGKHLLPETDWSAYEEPAYTLPAVEDMRVFPDGTLPEEYRFDGDALSAKIKEQRKRELQTVLTQDREELIAQFRTPLAEMMGINLSRTVSLEDRGTHAEISRYVVRTVDPVYEIPMIASGKQANSSGQAATLLAHPRGKHALLNPENLAFYPQLLPEDATTAVYALDVFLTGETNNPNSGAYRKAERPFDTTFLPTDSGYRTQDILDAVAAIKAAGHTDVHVAGYGVASLWVLFAAALTDDINTYSIEESALPKDDKTWAKDRRVKEIFVPGIQAVGGLELLRKLADR